MPHTIATHYDNLNVSRDAPVEAIKKAYRKLSQQYHPDRNADPAALEIMKLINLAWDVLSDPERRARHDRAIASLETRAVRRAPAASRAAARPAPPVASRLPVAWRIGGAALAALLVLLVAVNADKFGAEDDADEPVATLASMPDDALATVAAQSDRPPHGYLRTSAQDDTPGIAMVDIDNTGGVRDAEVRLFRNDRSARSVYVHHGKRFVVENLAPGAYVVKYKFSAEGKVEAYQERALFRPQRDKFSKLKITLPGAAGISGSADRIAADLF
jgi:curved DNA-binding protein CbpA